MFRRLINALLNRKKWPDTKNNYQSDIDIFLQEFNKNRKELSPSREQEKAQCAIVAQKRDHISKEVPCSFENF